MKKFSYFYFKISLASTLAATILFAGVNANAGMSIFSTFTGEGAGVSIDGVAMGDTLTNSIQVEVPPSAVINSAYLYSADVFGGGLSNVTFQGNLLVSNAASRLDVGPKQGNPAQENRWDVTTIVTSVTGAGPVAGGIYNFDVTEHGFLDGEILAVTYSVSGGPVNTVMIFDGELATTGDSFNVSLATPFTAGDDAIMSIGASFGFQTPFNGGQHTEIDINGARLTSSADGQDDGFDSNGGLITVGGVGDSTDNPADPNLINAPNLPFYDDELYNLSSFLSTGDNLISIATINPSNDDNVFFTALTVKGVADVCVGPTCNPNPVPEPSTAILFGLGLFGMIAVKIRYQF